MWNRSSHQYGRSLALTIVMVATAAAVVGTVVSGLRGGNPLGLAWLESTPPQITFVAAPAGLGAKPSPFVVSVSDPAAGIARVAISISQDGKKHMLLERGYERGAALNEQLTAAVDARSLGLHEGPAVISVSAQDFSALKNSASVAQDAVVDFSAPRVEPLSAQQNGSVGGVELVVFRHSGRPLATGGVESSQGKVYQGYSLAAFDADKSFPEGTYFALFPIPYDFSPESDTLRLAVTDTFGNSASAPFNYRIAPKTFPEVNMGLSEQFLSSKVPPLLERLRSANAAAVSSGQAAGDFKLVNEELRSLNESTVRAVLAENRDSPRMWRGAFIRPLAAAPKASFAEGRRYILKGEEISKSRHMGVDLADVAHAQVSAANHGRVVFSGDLGIYGETVIVDHGVGVSSLYGHLSSRTAKKGDLVVQGQEIGRTGTTGLAGGDHLHYEIRVQGEPVSPLAWLDARWIAEHLEQKVSSFSVQQTETDRGQGGAKS